MALKTQEITYMNYKPHGIKPIYVLDIGPSANEYRLKDVLLPQGLADKDVMQVNSLPLFRI
jgi:hypothetical protein